MTGFPLFFILVGVAMLFGGFGWLLSVNTPELNSSPIGSHKWPLALLGFGMLVLTTSLYSL